VLIPAGKRYTPADLGLDAVVIAPSGTGTGTIVPWVAGFQFSAVTFIATLAAVVINGTLRIRVFDFDGTTQLFSTPVTLVSGMNATLIMAYYGLDTPRSSAGATLVTSVPAALGSPFARFVVDNVDAVNALTVSVSAILHKGSSE
jgi:hypothetical protein